MTADVDRGPMADTTGKVVTVNGPIGPERLGPTLMHEHLLTDLRKTHIPYVNWVVRDDRIVPAATRFDFPATELALWEAKIGLGNLHLAREMAPIADNYLLADEEMATREAMEVEKHGGGTIVDVTSIGLKRDPEAIRRISNATGLNIVMGTGFYQRVYHPDDMDERNVEDLVVEIVREITVGIADTGIRSGIVGEVGVNGGPIITNEIKSIRAAAQAGILTGAAISFHAVAPGTERHRILDVVAEEGADLTRVILGHSDGIASDLPFMLELLARGVYIQFDLLGREQTLVPSDTSHVAQAIPQLIAAGYEDRILLSHDVCWKIHLKHYGGFGYSFIFEKFLPHLKEIGVTDSQVNSLMVENPKRVLPFVAPRS